MQLIHTCFWVVDLDRSVAFYERLGFIVWSRGPFREGQHYAFMGMPGDGPRLELNLTEGVESYDVGTGYRHIAVVIPDVDATLASLAELGYQPDMPPAELPEVGGTTMCTIRDPDGYTIEVWSPSGPQFEAPPGG